jgi:DNA modification methylase
MTVTILTGDCREQLRTLADGSVNCIVTSPPYYGLRDYGHDGQLGLEETPDEYVAQMVAVFRETRRVLRDDGTLWLNIGDTYNNNPSTSDIPRIEQGNGSGAFQIPPEKHITARRAKPNKAQPLIDRGIKKKDLIGIPWMLAFALRADGWYLRQDIIWHKPNPMPESVRDRCTKSHEYVFLLSKSPRYLFDAEAIAEPQTKGTAGSLFNAGKTAEHQLGRASDGERKQATRAAELAMAAGLTDAHIEAIRAVGITDTGKARVTQDGTGKNDPAVQALADEAKEALGGYYREFLIASSRNKRDVWTIATQPFAEAHFATMAPELARTCIMAGCPLGGTVLDPFGGAGTTGLVADQLQRNAILIELNPEYVEIARKRINADAGMFATEAA